MNAERDEHVTARIEAIYRAESRRVLATLIRLLGDFDLAEEALAEAFRAAIEQWPRDGVPANPARVAGLGRALQRHRRDPPPDPLRCAAIDLASALDAVPAEIRPRADRKGSRTTGCA